MKDIIDAALRPLVNQPLTDMWRYAGFQRFEFGEQRPTKNRRGEPTTLSDWALVVGCDWRITGPDGVIVSSADFNSETGGTDEKAYPFYALLRETPPVVRQIRADERGALRIEMEPGFVLEVEPPAAADPEDHNEDWLFLPRDRRRSRFSLERGELEHWRATD